jgi:hypothetical protein
MQPEGPYLLTTSSGRSLDLNAPSAEDIHVEDIARALSKICRFGAQATAFYSVAQHATEVAARVPPELRLAALHHDSHEAFVGDVPTPLKSLLRSKSLVYDVIAANLDDAIAEALGIERALFKHPEVKRADNFVLVMESSSLLPDRGASVRAALSESLPVEQVGTVEKLLTPTEAETAFLAAHRQYSAAAVGSP